MLSFNPCFHVGSDSHGDLLYRRYVVSIHAPYAGSDLMVKNAVMIYLKFQSTPPMQGATYLEGDGSGVMGVSIHAPYAGSDTKTKHISKFVCQFQSTPPMQGATAEALYCLLPDIGFNPRPLCRERLRDGGLRILSRSFNPRPLCRERLNGGKARNGNKKVSIHAPYAGSDGIYIPHSCISE